MIVMDTCAFIWLGLDKEKLSTPAVKAIRSDSLFISDITFLEKCKVLMTLLSGKKLWVRVPVRDDMFTRDPEKTKAIREDEIKLEMMTTHFCREVLKMDRWVNNNLNRMCVPTLILLASEDDVVDISRIQTKLFPRLGASSKALEVYNCYHHLFFEPHGTEVVERIVKWIRTEQQ